MVLAQARDAAGRGGMEPAAGGGGALDGICICIYIYI